MADPASPRFNPGGGNPDLRQLLMPAPGPNDPYSQQLQQLLGLRSMGSPGPVGPQMGPGLPGGSLPGKNAMGGSPQAPPGQSMTNNPGKNQGNINTQSPRPPQPPTGFTSRSPQGK